MAILSVAIVLQAEQAVHGSGMIACTYDRSTVQRGEIRIALAEVVASVMGGLAELSAGAWLGINGVCFYACKSLS